MRLVVFDIDTALCQSSAMEGYALCQAVADLTRTTVSTLMPETVHPFHTAVTQLLGRTPKPAELHYLRGRFRLHLKRQSLFHNKTIQANQSMVDNMLELMRSRDAVVGLVASTCSQVLALKARNLGLVIDAMPCASKDDGETLEAVLTTVKARAMRSFGDSFRQFQLVASDAWREAAIRQQMEFLTPAAFVQALEVESV